MTLASAAEPVSAAMTDAEIRATAQQLLSEQSAVVAIVARVCPDQLPRMSRESDDWRPALRACLLEISADHKLPPCGELTER